MIRHIIKDAQQRFVQTYLLIIVVTMKVKVPFFLPGPITWIRLLVVPLVGGAGDADCVVAVDGAFSEAVWLWRRSITCRTKKYLKCCFEANPPNLWSWCDWWCFHICEHKSYSVTSETAQDGCWGLWHGAMCEILMFCQMLQASHHCRQSVLTLGFICVTLCFPFAPDFGAHS